MRVVDGDGHVTEGPRGSDLIEFLDEPYRSAKLTFGVFPDIDHLHNEPITYPPDSVPGSSDHRRVGPPEWSAFLEDVGIEASVLYPSNGLGVGLIANRDWAIAVTRAYNDWLYSTYLTTNPALQGMALLPMQDPDASVDELRRAVEDLGMRGAMLPAVGLRSQLGSKEYWPVYAEAERLGCALAVHGGVSSRLGFDHMEVRPGTHALGHPLGVLISLTSIVFNGVFDRYPGVRFGFLEGGVAWLLVAMERFDRSYETHVPYNPRGELLQLDPGESVAGYLASLAEGGRLAIGCEGDEFDLLRGVELLGSGAFMFSSDFPHEVGPQRCKEEIAELLERPGLSERQKADILGESARRFYRLE